MSSTWIRSVHTDKVLHSRFSAVSTFMLNSVQIQSIKELSFHIYKKTTMLELSKIKKKNYFI